MTNRISIHLKGLEALHWATNLPLSSFTMPFPYSPYHNIALYFNSVWKHLYIMWLKRYVNQRQQNFQQVLGWPTLDKVPYIIHIIYWNQLLWQHGYLVIKLLSYIQCVYFILMCIVDVLLTHQFLSFLFCIVLKHTCMQPLWQLSGLQAGGIRFESGPEICMVFCLARCNWC